MALRAMNARSLSRAIGQVRRMSTEKPSKVLVSLAGPDRVGVVKDFSSALHKSHGNVEESRMAQLGGEFAMISLVTVRPSELADLRSELKGIFSDFSLAMRETTESQPTRMKEYVLEVDGPDSIGIVAQITQALSKKGGSIKSLDTETVPAPFAGFDLFRMKAIIDIEPEHLEELQEAVEGVGDKFGLDIASLVESPTKK
ncbi:hypothetical protein NDN08_006043 [Rhodosorus marinus]|uniref:ACT domain-containing protein n=1 Tax=Rhodosorus marinus TaxID=101924 RepID=A0AAV8UNQ5_9RHOD|nr:hypothetical protein NDN08_006043 [Rhodosorus marinus]